MPLPLIPQPASLTTTPACSFSAPRLVVAASLDPGGREILDERLRALGIAPTATGTPNLRIERDRSLVAQSYRLVVAPRSVTIAASDGDGAFNGLATLAQLVRPAGARATLPCVTVADRPALAWRIVSDDVSRGPLPTMRYFKERIRTLAAFKINGYSPYIEHVVVTPEHPLPAPLDGITLAELHELDAYAKRFHVALIPEQQSFAHMHETLKWERYADLAELPHGYLLSPEREGTYTYLRDVIGEELRAVPHPPFFHIGADEPSDLGRGTSKAAVDANGPAAVYAQHVDRVEAIIAPSGARPMIWDDAIQQHPEVMTTLPKSLVIVSWHYGLEKSYRPYLDRVANGGFEQLVSPGDWNWNELYPDLGIALPAEDRFITEGKAAHVLGLFQTVWHDDGESLYEATWFPVLYAAASAWEAGSVPVERFRADFPWTFFASDDARFGDDIATLGTIRTLLHKSGDIGSGDYLFWADPFDARILARVQNADLRQIRLDAETVASHLRVAPAPRAHANAAAVMALAARRYDQLARNYQIAQEVHDYYNDAAAHAGKNQDNLVYRGLFVAKYLCWEMRDRMLELAPLYRVAWDYESRPGARERAALRYGMAAERATAYADRLAVTTNEGYYKTKTLPPFATAMGLTTP